MGEILADLNLHPVVRSYLLRQGAPQPFHISSPSTLGTIAGMLPEYAETRLLLSPTDEKMSKDDLYVRAETDWPKNDKRYKEGHLKLRFEGEDYFTLHPVINFYRLNKIEDYNDNYGNKSICIFSPFIRCTYVYSQRKKKSDTIDLSMEGIMQNINIPTPKIVLDGNGIWRFEY